MTLRVIPEADEEALEAAGWYEVQVPALGDEFLVERERAVDRVGDNPQSFARLEYYAGPHEIRRCVMRRFPYAVIFQCRPDEVLIVAIAHLHREPLYWLGRLDE